jgi:hypothetical protein
MRILAAAGLTAVLAACGGTAAPVDEALARDLELVGTSSAFELAPTASGMQVMSALEQGEKAPTAAPAPVPERKPVAQAPRQATRRQAPAPRPAPQAVAEAPAPEPEVEFEQPAPAPRPAAAAPASQSAPLGAGPAPAGGWRNVNDVIRNSRVPINP